MLVTVILSYLLFLIERVQHYKVTLHVLQNT